jgi:apolipoprotein N-acyltransferase
MTKGPLLALASGLFLGLSFPSFDLWPVAWVSLFPLIALIQKEKGRRAFLLGWISGLGFYLLTLYWIVRTITSYSNVPLSLSILLYILLASVLGCYTGGFALIVSFLQRRRISLLFSAVPAWVAMEWLRSFFLIGFPWAALGYSQHLNRNLIQFAEITGVYGVSALIVFVNSVILSAFQVWRQRSQIAYVPLFFLVTLLFTLCQWGSWRARHVSAVGDPRLTVGIVQGNIAQEQKWDPDFQRETFRRYLDLTERAVQSGALLVIWPETAVPFFFQSDLRKQKLIQAAQRNRIHLLFGSPAFEAGSEVIHLLNRAYLISSEGKVSGFYDKMILVPFGEYVPLQWLIPFVRKLVVGIGDFIAGKDATLLSIDPQARFGVLICYEGIFPELSRQFVDNGANFLVNITNDAWFGRTSAPYQHLSMLTFRAIENRVPILRAANTGFSAFIKADGSVWEKTELFTADVRTASVGWANRKTIYTEWGDLFAQFCFVLVIALIGCGGILAKRQGEQDHERNSGENLRTRGENCTALGASLTFKRKKIVRRLSMR